MQSETRQRADYLIDGLEYCRKAIEAFSAAIAADPNYLPAYEARAWVYKAAGQHEPASADLQRIRTFPESVESRYYELTPTRLH